MPASTKQMRLNLKAEEIRKSFGHRIEGLLEKQNQTRLGGKGNIAASSPLEDGSLRWTLTWRRTDGIALELDVIVQIEDSKQGARVSRVIVRRHASTPLDYEGHTPTTKMRRLSDLSIDAIQEAILSEWP